MPGEDGRNGLFRTADEPEGMNCTHGGVRIQMGLDDDRDGVLDSGEVESTVYVCDGEDGVGAYQSLIRMSMETPGANCTDGGQKLEFGLDNGDNGGTRGNSILEDGEVDRTQYVCNGTNGFNTLVRVTLEAPGIELRRTAARRSRPVWTTATARAASRATARSKPAKST